MPLPVLVTVSQVSEALGIARSSVYKLLATDPDFPRPVRVGPRSPRFREAEVEAWIAGATAAANE